MVVMDRFISNWHSNLIDTESNPWLRTYQTTKKSFRLETLETYLYLVREAPFRKVIAQIRASSHTFLAIERGRHTRLKTPDFAIRVVLLKTKDQSLRIDLMKNIESIYPKFRNMTENEQIYWIFNNEDLRILTWFWKILHNSFMLRREILS